MFGNEVEEVTIDGNILPTNELQAVTIEKYVLTFDFKDIDSITLETITSEYMGGIDSGGHERKNNYAEYASVLTFYDYGDSSTIMHYNGMNKDFVEEFPVSLDAVATEIEEFLNKAANDTNLSAYIKNKDGSRTYLNTDIQNENTAVEENNKENVSENAIRSAENHDKEPSVQKSYFRITDEHLGEGSKREKFQKNIEAIKTLQVLENEERPATPEEKVA